MTRTICMKGEIEITKDSQLFLRSSVFPIGNGVDLSNEIGPSASLPETIAIGKPIRANRRYPIKVSRRGA